MKGDGSLQLAHHGEEFELAADKPVTRATPEVPDQPRPPQPAGREPQRRHPLPGLTGS